MKQMQSTSHVDNVEAISERSLQQLHKPLCDDYAKLMRIKRDTITPDMVLNSAPGALQLVRLRIAADLVDKYVCFSFSAFLGAFCVFLGAKSLCHACRLLGRVRLFRFCLLYTSPSPRD